MSSTPNNNNWQSSTNPVATLNTKPADYATKGLAPMEVNTNTLICYSCYKEGHITKKCTQVEKSSYHKVIVKGQENCVADSSMSKEELKEGSSKDSTPEVS